MTKKRVHAELLRTIGIAAVGFLALLAVAEWATGPVALFVSTRCSSPSSTTTFARLRRRA